jgi:hypothetical protein
MPRRVPTRSGKPGLRADGVGGADGRADGTEWKQRQLVRAGFDPALAACLVEDAAIDLHALIELAERGCPPDLALRILAPLEAGEPSC